MREFVQSNPFAVIAVFCLVFAAWGAVMAFRIGWLYRAMGLVDKYRRSSFDAVRYLARAQWLAKRYGEGHAYHVCEDGVLLEVSAEEYLVALFAGIEDFWHLVSKDRRAVEDGAVFAEKADGGDGERYMTVICAHCGKTYLDSIAFPCDLPYPYLSRRATLQDLSQELEDCRNGCNHGKSSCGRCDEGLEVHD